VSPTSHTDTLREMKKLVQQFEITVSRTTQSIGGTDELGDRAALPSIFLTLTKPTRVDVLLAAEGHRPGVPWMSMAHVPRPADCDGTEAVLL
jgi:hypothetical protein